MPASAPVLVCEADTFGKIAHILFDTRRDEEQRAALADFFSNDLEFDVWCDRLRKAVPNLLPADVRLVKTDAELDANLAEAEALLIESFEVTRERLATAPKLRVVLKNGVVVRNIDVDAVKERGIELITVRRRANMGVSETAMALMLMLAKRSWETVGQVTFGALERAGRPFKAFDRRHAANANFARVPGLRALHGSTLGLVGFGEIGREIALRANAFGMNVLYHQRTRLAPEEEQRLGVRFAPMPELLAASDWLIPQLPLEKSTRGIVSRDWLEQLKTGAYLVVVARAELVDRDALIWALRSGKIAGLGLDPLYDEPMRDDDELLGFKNVVLLPHIASQPRFNVLGDVEEIITRVGRALAVTR